MQLTIQGAPYEVPSLSTLKIMPFLTALGLDYDLLTSTPRAIAASREDLGRTVMIALGDPSNHYKLAFALQQMVPNIDPAIASFKSIERPGGSTTEQFLGQQRRGNQQFIQDEFFGSGGSGALDRVDPGRTRPEEVLAQAGQFATELAPQFAGLQGGIQELAPLQGQGNDLLREISTGIQQLSSAGTGAPTFQIDVDFVVNAGSQPTAVADATGQAIERKLRDVFRATAQLAR